ncbi:MAG: hypothetical protein HC849_19180 [Oscillatoriales cyanobacterium RU_3_3]|nr:hypothetical protein [Oscillatoriales cyanobacterium RU_3_3]NJR23252.1 hypothetical protein [Richelia sp. CSU_2_1]
MRTIAARRAISALAVMPILLIANTTETLASTNAQKSEPMKNVSDVNSELDFDFAIPTLSGMEESEDWDEPDFSESLDTSPTLNMQLTEFINSNMKVETDDRWPTIIDENIVLETSEPLPTIYISAARGQSTRECRISGICE